MTLKSSNSKAAPLANAGPTVTFNGKPFDFVNETDSILETIERAGIELEFHCREGFCGVCRTKLVSGEITYTLDPLAFIEDDEVLICCSRPVGDIEIKSVI